MMASRQELEKISAMEKQALAEVDGYIERVEKGAEKQSSGMTLNTVQSPIALPIAPIDPAKLALQGAKEAELKKIVLPMNQEEIRSGLHAKIMEGALWLSKWCVLMIKKYPGRVFYPVAA